MVLYLSPGVMPEHNISSKSCAILVLPPNTSHSLQKMKEKEHNKLVRDWLGYMPYM